MIKFISAIVLALSFTTSAQAWGDREQGALAGIVGTLLWQKLEQQQPAPYRPQVIQQPVYVPPTVIYQYPQAMPERQCYVFRETRNYNGTYTREIRCHGLQ
jgi:hypothetical protein